MYQTPRGLILEGGPSPHGPSRSTALMECPRRYALKYIEGLRKSSFPAFWGTGFHLWLSQRYMRKMEYDAGRDPSKYAHPFDLADYWVPTLEGNEHKWARMMGNQWHTAYKKYNAHYGQEPHIRVLGCEVELTYPLFSHLAKNIQPTQGLDFHFETPDGKVWYMDWKCSGRPPHEDAKGYFVSAQCVQYWAHGLETYGENFGGVLLRYVSKPSKANGNYDDKEDYKFFDIPVPCYQDRVDQLRRKYELLAPQLALYSSLPPEEWPRADNKKVCIGEWECEFLKSHCNADPILPVWRYGA